MKSLHKQVHPALTIIILGFLTITSLGLLFITFNIITKQAPVSVPLQDSRAVGSVFMAGPIALPQTGALFGTRYTRHGAEFGNSETTATRQQDLLDSEAVIGRKYALDRSFHSNWSQVPNAYEQWTAGQGRIPWISVKPCSGGWATVANNQCTNPTIAEMADSIKAWGKPMIFTFHHEPWSDGDPAQYVSAFRKIHEIFTQRGVTNVAYANIDITYNFIASNFNEAIKYYPGDDVIDIIGSDPYNFIANPVTNDAAYFNKNWKNSFSDTNYFDAWYNWAVAKGKPLAFAEYASLEDPFTSGRKAAWLRQFLTDMKTKYPAVKIVTYFDKKHNNSGVIRDWNSDSSPSSGDAYREIANDPYFNVNLTVTPTSQPTNTPTPISPTPTPVPPTPTRTPTPVPPTPTRTPTPTPIPPTPTRTPTPTPLPPPPTSTPTPVPLSGIGLRGEYYRNTDFTLVKFQKSPEVKTDAQVNFDWGKDGPSGVNGTNTFSIRWTGYVTITTPGVYTFYTQADDGTRLWIGSNLIIDDWSNHSLRERAGLVSFSAPGRYPIRLDYYENTSLATVKLLWEGPGISKTIIPQQRLNPN